MNRFTFFLSTFILISVCASSIFASIIITDKNGKSYDSNSISSGSSSNSYKKEEPPCEVYRINSWVYGGGKKKLEIKVGGIFYEIEYNSNNFNKDFELIQEVKDACKKGKAPETVGFRKSDKQN